MKRTLTIYQAGLTLALGVFLLGGCNYREDFGGPSEDELHRIAEGNVTYSVAVKTVIGPRCLSCHSGPSPKAALDLSQYESALDSGYITAGNVADSPLFDQVRDDLMPPPSSHKPLTPGEKQIIHRWIETGAQK